MHIDVTRAYIPPSEETDGREARSGACVPLKCLQQLGARLGEASTGLFHF
jgi:hypothetical protein